MICIGFSLGNELSADLVRQIGPVRSTEVRLVSCIGHPIDQPELVYVTLGLPDAELPGVRLEVQALVHAHLANITALTARLVAGEVLVF